MENKWIFGKVLGAAVAAGFVLGIGKSFLDDQQETMERTQQQRNREKELLLKEQLTVEVLTGDFAKTWFMDHTHQNPAGYKLLVSRLTPELASDLSDSDMPLDPERYVLFALLSENGEVIVTQLVNFGKISEKMAQNLDKNDGSLMVEA